MRILVFGDSITYGAWDSEGGWVERLKRWAHGHYLVHGTKLQVSNLGVGGDTSTKILARMEQEIVARHSASWPFVIILMLGSNDGRVRNGETEVTLEQFTKNYNRLIEIAQKYTDKIITVGLPPIGEPILDFKDMQYSDQAVLEYETKIRTLATERKLPFVEVRPLFRDGTLLSSDKLHPNDEGHKVIYEAVKAEVEKLLR